MDEIEVKGITFSSVLGAMEDLRGKAFRDKVIGRLPEESGAALRYGSVIASGWYPIRWYRELFGAALDLAGDMGLARQIGRASLRREVNGVHRLLFRMLSVETLQRKGTGFFKAYFRPTEVAIERIDHGVAWTRYIGCKGFDRNLWQEQVGCIEELLAQSGAKRPRVRVLKGGGDTDDFMEVETRWS